MDELTLRKFCLYLLEEFFRDVFVVVEEGARRVVANRELLAVEFVGSTGLFNKAELLAKRNELALAADALVVEEVKLGCLEGRGDLILHHFYPYSTSDNFFAFFNRSDAANV